MSRRAIPRRPAGRLLAGLVLAAACLGGLGAEGLELQGSLRQRNALSIADAGIAENSQSLELTVKGRKDSSGLVLSPYLRLEDAATLEWGLREAYVDLYSPLGDLRLGKQAVVWGQAEGAFITDIVCPQDLGSFILADFREIRKALPAVRLSEYLGPLSLDAVWIPWFEPATLPAADSPWRLPAMPDLAAAPRPEASFGNSEFFGRIAYFGSGLSAELMGGWTWDDFPVATGSPLAPSLEYRRMAVAGGSMNVGLGPAVIRLESAVYLDRSLTALVPGMPPRLITLEKNQVQALAGLDTSLLGVDLSAQYIHQWIPDYDERLRAEELVQTITFRARDSFLDERLRLGLFTYVEAGDWNALVRPELSWIPEDGLEVGFQADLFLGDGEGRFGVYDDRDLASLSVRWYF